MHACSRWLILSGAFLFSCFALGATRPSTPSLRQLADKSGYIFGGTVVAIQRMPVSSPGEVPTVQITFRVDQAIRNTQAKQLLTIREWAGLWESGQRYRVGERLVLFLYRPSKLGLTSTVAGAFGRFSMDDRGRVLLQPGQLDELRGNPPAKIPVRTPSPISGRALADAIQGRFAR